MTARLSRALVFVLPLFCSAYFFPRWADVNANSRMDMVLAIVQDGTLRIDHYVQNTVDYAEVDGHYYSDKAPGAALLGVPLYAGFAALLDTPVVRVLTDRLAEHSAFRATLRADGSGVSMDKVRFALAQVWLSFALAAVPTALLCVVMHDHLCAHGMRPMAAVAVPLIYALATPAFAYANAFYGHQLAALLGFAAFAVVARWPQQMSVGRMRGEALFTGLLLGYAVLTEYPAIIVAGVVFAYAVWHCIGMRRFDALAALVLGGATCAAGLMLYNTLVFGGPFDLGYAHSTLWTAQHSTGLFSIGLPQPNVLIEILFGEFRGLFVLSPVLLLTVFGFVMWLRSGRHRAQWWVAVGAASGMLLFNASSSMWWGGWSVGPRYLLPALPFVVLALPFALGTTASLHRAGLLTFASVLATWSMTTAGQSFPSDALHDPWVEHVMAAWMTTDVARSWGTLFGLRGIMVFAPPAAFVAAALGLWAFLMRRSRI